MSNADKALKISIQGDASQFGAATKQAVSQINEVRNAAQSMLAGFTGGVLGGGVLGAVQGVVNLVAGQIREARQLLRDARSQELSKDFLAGARFFSERIGQDPKLVENAIANARQSRSDALTGDDNAIAAWERLGVSLREIQDLAPEDLFKRIAQVFKDTKDGTLNLRQVQGAAGVLGRGEANALLPYFAGGTEGSLNLPDLFKGDFSNLALRNSLIYATGMEDILSRPAWRRKMEPISMEGVGNEEQAARIQQQAQEVRNASLREEMGIEERLKDMLKQRWEILKKISEESDSVKRARLGLQLEQLDAEAGRLSRTMGQPDSGSGLSASPLFRSAPDVDEFARRGLYVGGQSQTAAFQERLIATNQALLSEIKQVRSENTGFWK